MAKEEPNPRPEDVHIGSRIRLRRTLVGMSQGTLGDELGLTFQQIQKYEKGTNRVSGSRFYDLSRVLDVPVGFFFDDAPEGIGVRSIFKDTTQELGVPVILKTTKDLMEKLPRPLREIALNCWHLMVKAIEANNG